MRLFDGILRRKDVIVIALAVIAIVWYCFPLQIAREINVKSLNHWGGHAYAVRIDGELPGPIVSALISLRPDLPDAPGESSLRLLENHVPIGLAHSVHEAVIQTGLGRFSHWRTDFVFSSSDNTSPITNGRKYEVAFPVAPPAWTVFVLFALSLPALRRALRWNAGRAPALAFWAASAFCVAYLNFALWSLLQMPVPTPDSHGYLFWSLFRTPGYPLFLDAYHAIAGSWAYLPLVQLDLLVGGLLLLAYAIRRATGGYFWPWVMLAITLAAGDMMLSATELLTEATFTAFVMMHVALLVLFLEGRRGWLIAASGALLAFAILVKSVGIVLLGPVLLFVAMSPGIRKRMAVFLIVPALLAWLVPSAYNLWRFGFFESSVAGGYALGGHVAWLIHPVPGDPYATEARLIEVRLQPELSKRPVAFANMEQYGDYTSNEYNTLLWGNIIPELASYYYYKVKPPLSGAECTWKRCDANNVSIAINRTLMHLSKQAILGHPREFAYHVAAHDIGLWRYVFLSNRNFVHGVNGRAEFLPLAFAPDAPFLKILGPLRAKSSQERLEIISSIDHSAATRLYDLVTVKDLSSDLLKLGHHFPVVLFVIALLGSALVIVLPLTSLAEKAFCYTSLCVNAYFLGTALAQPALVRYAWVMQSLVLAMLVLGAASAVRMPVSFLRGYEALAAPLRRRLGAP